MPSDEMVEKAWQAISGCKDIRGTPLGHVRSISEMREIARAALAAAEAGEPVAARSSFGPGSYLADVMTMGAGRQSTASPPSEASRDERETVAYQNDIYTRGVRMGRRLALSEAAQLVATYDPDFSATNSMLDDIAAAIRERGET